MKNKPLTYLLLIACLGIWGTVIFKIIGSHSDTATQPTQTTSVVQTVPVALDSFSIAANYRDPFLGRMHVSYTSSSTKKTASTKKTSAKKKQKDETAPQFIWPTIEFTGYYEDESGESANVKINAQYYLIKEKDIVNKILFDQVGKDSLRVTFKDRSKHIKINGL